MKPRFLGLLRLCLCLFLGFIIQGCSTLKEQIPTQEGYRTYRAFAHVVEGGDPAYMRQIEWNIGYNPVQVVLLLKVRNDGELNEVRNRLSSEGIFVREFILVNP